MKSTTCASRAPGESSDGRISAAMASRSRSCPGASTRPADAKPGLAGPAIQVAASFADLPEADAVALLRELEAERSDFFEAARVATISGFLANPEYGGNAGKAGWRAIGFDDRFVWTEPFGWYDQEANLGD